jgi:hypothetical protein
LNKRQKKKTDKPKATVQEAWDIIAEHLVRRQEEVVCYFVSQTKYHDHITLTNADSLLVSKSTLKIDAIEAKLRAKGEII